MNALNWVLIGVLAAFLISVSHALSVVALRRLSLPSFLCLRALAGFVFSLPWLGSLLGTRLEPHTWILFGISLLLSPFLISVLYFQGLSGGRLASQSALRQVSPCMVVLWQWAVLGTATSARDWCGVALTLSGSALIICERPVGYARAGVFFGLAAAAVHAATLIVQADVLVHLDPKSLVAAQNILFAAVTLTWAGLAGRNTAPASTSTPLTSMPSISTAVILSLVSGFIVQVLFDRLKFAILPHLGAFQTACLLLLQLPFFALIALVVFKERMSRRQTSALILVFCGSLISSL